MFCSTVEVILFFNLGPKLIALAIVTRTANVCPKLFNNQITKLCFSPLNGLENSLLANQIALFPSDNFLLITMRCVIITID